MYRFILPLILLLACASAAVGQNIAESPVLNENPTRSGFSTHLAFEITTPSGSHGRWTTGGGATLTLSYTYYINEKWFVSPGVGAFYNTMGTDFIPEYDHVYEGTVKNYGARIPVLGGMAFRLTDDLTLALATGPLLNINIYAKEHPSPDFEATPVEPDDPINLFGHCFHRADLQWEFFAGLTYKRHYCVGISGAAGITNAASMTCGQRSLKIRRNNFALMLSYTF